MRLILNEKKIIKFYKNGKSCLYISKFFGVSDGTIKRILEKNDIKIRNISQSRLKNYNYDKIIKLYEKGESPIKISKKIDCSPTTIRNILKRMNITLRNKSEAGKLKKITKETCKKISKAKTGLKTNDKTKKKLSMIRKKFINENPEVFFSWTKPKFSKGHKRIEKLLKDNNINFIHEYKIELYSIDIFLPDYNICLEIDGEYWHNLNDRKERDYNRDTRLKELGYKVIRLYHNKEAMKITFNKLMDKLLEELREND